MFSAAEQSLVNSVLLSKSELIELIKNHNLFALEAAFKNVMVNKNNSDQWLLFQNILIDCLWKALELGYADIAEYLILKIDDLTPTKRIQSKELDVTLLGLAALSGCVYCVRVVADRMHALGLLEAAKTDVLNPLFACAVAAQVSTFDVLVNEYGFDPVQAKQEKTTLIHICLLSDDKKILGNDLKFLKHLLKTTSIDINAEFMTNTSALQLALDNGAVACARLLIMYGADIRKKYNWFEDIESVARRNAWDSSNPELCKINGFIQAYQYLTKLMTSQSNMLDHEHASNMGMIENYLECVLDYIEAQSCQKTLSECAGVNLKKLIEATIFHTINEGKITAAITLLNWFPQYVHIKNAENYSLISLLLHKHQAADNRHKIAINIENVNPLFTILHRYHFNFDESDATGKSAWQQLAKEHLLAELLTMNVACIMKHTVDLLKQSRHADAQNNLMHAMQIDMTYVTDYLKSLVEIATIQADTYLHNETLQASDYDDFSYLAKLVEMYRKTVGDFFGDMLGDLLAYNVENKKILRPVFHTRDAKLDFIQQFSADFPLPTAWLATPEWKNATLVNQKKILAQSSIFARKLEAQDYNNDDKTQQPCAHQT